MIQNENPRLTALNILQDVSRAGAYASLALGKRLRDSRLPQRDRDLVAELVYGTLERQLTLDYFIDRRLTGTDVDPVIRDILRMGAYQILFLTRVPDSAAVDESVKIARLLNKEMYTGLVNGVLRNIVRQKDALPYPKMADDPALALSVRHSLPQWIVERLISAYGIDAAREIAAYRPEERGVIVRRAAERISQADFEALMTKKNWQWKPAQLPGAYRVTGVGDVGIDAEYLKGLFSVQGEASMLAAIAVAPKRGFSLLDACAAPGGKTACLSEMMQGTGRVYAWDVHEHRVELLRSMVRRLHLDNVRPAVRDAKVFKPDLEQTMDAVLLDAPCSGLGVMLGKPDVKYRQSPETVADLCALQRELLDTCARYVKPGGALVYSTCTILPEENTEQVAAFLARHPEFAPDAEGLLSALPEAFRARLDGCMLQLFAHRDGMEGFFIARMKRMR